MVSLYQKLGKRTVTTCAWHGCLFVCFLCLSMLQSRIQPQRMVQPLLCRSSHLSLPNQENPHKHAQRPISQLALNLIKMTTDDNHQAFLGALTGTSLLSWKPRRSKIMTVPGTLISKLPLRYHKENGKKKNPGF